MELPTKKRADTPEISQILVGGVLNAAAVGERQIHKFIHRGLRISFFATIRTSWALAEPGRGASSTPPKVYAVQRTNEQPVDPRLLEGRIGGLRPGRSAPTGARRVGNCGMKPLFLPPLLLGCRGEGFLENFRRRFFGVLLS